MPAPNIEKPFKIYPGRSRPREIEDRPDDKHDRSLMRQHDPQPDWGRDMEQRLQQKRSKNGPTGIF